MPNMYRLKVHKGIFCFILLFNQVIGESPAHPTHKPDSFVKGKSCDPSDLVRPQCPQTQLCEETTATCQCQPGFKAHNDTFCVEVNPRNSRMPTPNTSSLVASHNSGAIVAGILIPLFLILFVIYAVYVSRKYKLVSWFRRKIHQRNNNYDEFMIGQEQDLEDDPPLR
jgi:hypothetical protein